MKNWHFTRMGAVLAVVISAQLTTTHPTVIELKITNNLPIPITFTPAVWSRDYAWDRQGKITPNMGWIIDTSRKPRVLASTETTPINNPADWIAGASLNLFKDQIRGGFITFADGRQPVEIWLRANGMFTRDFFVTVSGCASAYNGTFGRRCLATNILGDPGSLFAREITDESWIASGLIAREIVVYTDEKTTIKAQGLLGSLYPDSKFTVENTPLTKNSAKA